MTQVTAGRSAAVQAALAKVRRNGGTAALAMVLAPLAAGVMASSAQAAVIKTQPQLMTNQSITGATSTAGGVTTFTYSVSNSDTSQNLFKFEIPEVAAGDFNVASFTGPEGWTATQETGASIGGSGFKDGSLAGAYILVQATGRTGISESQGAVRFTMTTTELGTLNANFGAATGSFNDGAGAYNMNNSGYIDPPVPGGPAAVATVPEPASMLILGGALLAAGGTRTRRRA